MQRNTFANIVAAAFMVGVAPPHVAVGQVPEFLGVYAVSGGNLVELKSENAVPAMGLALTGGQFDRKFAGPSFPAGAGLYFVIYKDGIVKEQELYVSPVRRVGYRAFVDGREVKFEALSDSWAIDVQKGFRLRLAPIKDNPSMMVKAVPEGALPAGYYGLIVQETVYLFSVGAHPSTECLVLDQRNPLLFVNVGGRNFVACDEFFAKNTGFHRDSRQASAAVPSGGREGGEATAPFESTGLQWTPRDNGGNVTWLHAEAYCSGLVLGGFDDWRLPTIEELGALYDASSVKRYKSKEGVDLTFHGIWSGDSSKHLGFAARYFDFSAGKALSANKKALAHALCVRSAGN